MINERALNNCKNVIEHEGIVSFVDHHTVKVNLAIQSACQGCHSKQICSLSETAQKTVEIDYPHHRLSIGDHVVVQMRQALGLKAMLLGYICPFCLLFLSLLASYTITNNEIFSGLISLGSLIPYYLALFFFKNRIKKEFSFSLKI